MLTIERSPHFLSLLCKIKNKADQDRIKKQIRKIIENPETGKPMRYTRKGTREVYVGSFRLSYAYLKEENKLIFLDLYHKDEQ
ncbi:MAG: type II toxin-antitoxin system RelE/ParE family toxin [Nanoarchaeota archaeon]|nr:type II toxin-antitoxin system RelE/ParE family toxin [Nanoarchaeota archaeon]MBU1622086.1 type II toxin-antitoxin system RelE/ParE family toxin [Nanoarchaeota archaeon]MBU1976520.1 type II toxin-antitoxin system RelE/ParE family toxin [Nanoarchaeota archaeon]